MNEYYVYNYMLRADDFYKVPICLLVLYLLAYIYRKQYDGQPIQKYIMPALTIRFVCAFLYTLVLQYYYGFGDSYNYFQGTLDMHRAVASDISFFNDIYGKAALETTDRIYPYFRYDLNGFTHYYMLEPRTYFVPKLALPFSILFNKSFLCISFCISFFSFLGSWKILLMFYEMYPKLHKRLAVACLFLPSSLFWGVSLLKDPYCIGAMGFFIYGCYSLFIRRKRYVSSIINIVFFGYLLLNLKPYILYALAAVFFIWFFYRFRDRIEDKTLRAISTILFTGLAVLGGYLATKGLSSTGTGSKFAADQVLNTVKQQQTVFLRNKGDDEGRVSNFNVSAIDESSEVSAFSLITLFPLGVVNTFFRPFPWDVRSPLMLLSLIESFGFLLLTLKCLRRAGIKKTIQIIVSDPVIAFCFLFAIIFGGVIGVTTLNFGALVRYKIPVIPFYAIAMFLIMEKSGKFPEKYVFSKRLF